MQLLPTLLPRCLPYGPQHRVGFSLGPPTLVPTPPKYVLPDPIPTEKDGPRSTPGTCLHGVLGLWSAHGSSDMGRERCDE